MNTKDIRDTRGFAIVVVLLVSSVILISVVVTASLTALGSRLSASDERTSYQALLASESGIDTLAARAAAEGYRGRGDVDSINTWLQSSGVGLVNFANGNNALLEVTNSAPADPTEDPNGVALRNVSARSASLVSNDNGRKIIVQEYRLTKPPRLNVGVPAALTSRTNIALTGNASVFGYSGASSDGLLNDAIQTDLSSNVTVSGIGDVVEIDVDSSRYIPGDGYIRIGDSTFRVESIADKSVTMTALELPGTPFTIYDNDPVDVVQSAITSDYNPSLSKTIQMNSVRGFLPGDTIYIGGDPAEFDDNDTSTTSDDTEAVESYDFKGTIDTNGVNATAGTLTVTWEGTAPSSFSGFAEGQAVRKDYRAATSSGSITDSGNGEIESTSYDPPGSNETSQTGAVLPSTFDGTESELFEQTFGMTYSEFQNLYDAYTNKSQIPTGVYPDGKSYYAMEDVTYFRGNLNFTGGQAICGSGIIVVEGDLTVNSTCPGGFKGVVYVMGEYSHQGNSVIEGAVVAEGGFGNKDTKIAGSGQGEPKIEFDPEEVFKQSQILSPWAFQPIAGTWRQR